MKFSIQKLSNLYAAAEVGTLYYVFKLGLDSMCATNEIHRVVYESFMYEWWRTSLQVLQNLKKLT